MTGQRVSLIGSGRTDAGVHAYGQVAGFQVKTNILPEEFLKGLNSLTPKDIVIKECLLLEKKFHARFDAKQKTYIYQILNRSNPAAICCQYAWYIKKKLDYDAMRRAIRHIRGTHDFKAFKGGGGGTANTTRSIITAEIIKKDKGYLNIEITGTGFLRFMVRNIVGTLVDVGLSKITPDDFKKILLSKDRNLAGVTAPPWGLFLIKVEY